MRYILSITLLLLAITAMAAGPNDGADLDDDLDYDGYSPTGMSGSQSENNMGPENEGKMDWSEALEQIDNHQEAWANFQSGNSSLQPVPGNSTVQPVYKHVAYATLKTTRGCLALLKAPTVTRCTRLAPFNVRLKIVVYSPLFSLPYPAIQGE
jgi:hypothetical protein